MVRKDVKHGLEALLDLDVAGHTRRVNVVHARTDLIRVAVLLECLEELHVALRRLDGDDVRVKALNGREDVVEVRVAEMRVRLEVVRDAGSGELEGVDRPLEVLVPVNAAQRETLANGGLVNLNGGDAGLLEVNDLVTKSERELLGLEFTGHIRARERPVEDRDRASEHTLHGLVRDALGVARPLDGHRSRATDVRHDDRGTHVPMWMRGEINTLGD